MYNTLSFVFKSKRLWGRKQVSHACSWVIKLRKTAQETANNNGFFLETELGNGLEWGEDISLYSLYLCHIFLLCAYFIF